MKKLNKRWKIILYGCSGLGVNMLNMIVGSYLCSALLIGGFDKHVEQWTYLNRDLVIAGLWGTLMFFIGFIAAIILGAGKLYALSNGIPQRLVTDSPYFYISLTMMILGTQLFLTGFLAELISRTSQERNKYNIAKEI